MLPEVNVSYRDLYKMLIAPIRSKLLLTGIELKVFNHMTEPNSADNVAEAMGTHPKNTSLFLDALVAIDLVQKKDGLYKNTPEAHTFLVDGCQTYLGQLCTFIARSFYPLENLSNLVKEGPPSIPESSPAHPTEEMLEQSYVAILANAERAGDAQLAVEIISKLPEFSSFWRMLDLGGGPGLIGMSIVDAHPNMKGVIFDLPPVVKAAESFIKEYGLEDRMKVLGGDFNDDSIGEGYDLILACYSLQFARDIDSVVKKVYDALNLGGVFVSFFPCGQTHERTKPETTVLSLLSLALMGYDTGFEHGFIADSMLHAGFKSVR